MSQHPSIPCHESSVPPCVCHHCGIEMVSGDGGARVCPECGRRRLPIGTTVCDSCGLPAIPDG